MEERSPSLMRCTLWSNFQTTFTVTTQPSILAGRMDKKRRRARHLSVGYSHLNVGFAFYFLNLQLQPSFKCWLHVGCTDVIKYNILLLFNVVI